MKNIILIIFCSVLSINITTAQTNTCECLDLSLTIMNEWIEAGMDDSMLVEIEKKYAKKSENCEKMYAEMGEVKFQTEMMACPRFNEMMELMMKLDPGYLEE